MPLVYCRHSVTWPDGLRWISVEPLGPGLAQLPGFQPGREVPDDHYRPIHRARHDPARLHRSRTARPRRVPRPDPRGLHLGPAPVHYLVSQPFPVAVLGAPRRDRKLRRQLEANGRARATVTRRLSTIAGFYKYAVEEELLDHSPAACVRRPRVDYESHAVALDRNELGALLVAADGRQIDRHGAGRLVRKVARRAGITKAVTPHTPSAREIGLRLMMLVADADEGVWRGVNGHLPREQARHLHRALSRDPPRESGRPALGMMADAGVTLPGKPVRCGRWGL
jgi:hypothetical protein